MSASTFHVNAYDAVLGRVKFLYIHESRYLLQLFHVSLD